MLNVGMSNNNNSMLKVCHLNVNSLTADVNLNRYVPAQHSKLDEIYSSLAIDNSFDVISLSETWLNENIPNDAIVLDSYAIFRKDRNRHGGGVMAYVKHVLPCTTCEDVSVTSEMLCLNLKLLHKKCLLCICYRPPGQNAEQITVFLEDVQNVIDYSFYKQFDVLIIMGDLNDRCSHWNDNRQRSELNTKLKDLVALNNLTQLINEPTHYTGHSAYLLDVIITDAPYNVLHSGVLNGICNLHHRPVYAKFNFKQVVHSSHNREMWHYKNGDYEGLNNELSNFGWDSVFQHDDVNDIVQDFQNVLVTTAKKYIPVKNITIRSKDKPWMNGNIKNLIRLRNRWCGRYNRTFSVEHRQIRDFYHNEVKKSIIDAKDAYFERIRDTLSKPELQAKKYWKIINSLFGNKIKKPIPTLIENNNNFSTDYEKACLLSEYFSSQSTLPPPPSDFSLPHFVYVTNSRIASIQVSSDEVKCVLNKLNVSKACGPDGIGNYLLKYTACSIADPLSKVFNQSLQKGIFPPLWKLANQCPLPKTKAATSKTNYRPISLLSCLSKVMERLVFNVMYKYLSENNLLTPKNSGFKENDGTINQLILLVHNIYNNLEVRKDTCMIFLDISKAFDRVYHQGLLFKLRQMGFEGQLLLWLESYLSNRQTRVILNSQCSEWRSINAGVPQGSILGPLLFLVFINDIVIDISSDIYLFADDTSLMRKITNARQDKDILNDDLMKLYNWSQQWRVTFNPQKTVFMLFSLKDRPGDIGPLSMNDQVIHEVENHTHLGLTLNNKIEWHSHVDNILNRVSKTVSSIKRLAQIIPRKTMQQLYTSLVRSVIDYGDCIYDNLKENCNAKLEAVQREAMVVCTGAIRRTSTESLCNEVGWEPLKIRREQRCLVMFYKMVRKLVPTYLSRLVPGQVRDTVNYNLRNRNQLQVPFARTVRYFNYFILSTSRRWNNLEPTIKNLSTVYQFKTALKQLYGYRTNKLYLVGLPQYHTHHTRLRLGLSGLHGHLYRYNIIQDGTCPNCYLGQEDTKHYVLHCPFYNIQRINLLEHLVETIPFEALSLLNDNALIHGLLHGFEFMSFTGNKTVFHLFQSFIKMTHRFP